MSGNSIIACPWTPTLYKSYVRIDLKPCRAHRSVIFTYTYI